MAFDLIPDNLIKEMLTNEDPKIRDELKIIWTDPKKLVEIVPQVF